MIRIKRAYEAPAPEDGFRILIDRLWPRGVAKAKARIDLWLKEIAPSNELRKAFGHDPAKWSGFQSKYNKELDRNLALLDQIRRLEQEKKTVTLIFAAQDAEHCNAAVLRERLAKIR